MPTTNIPLYDLQYPLYLIAGSNLKRGFRFKIDEDTIMPLTGYHAAIHIREKPSDITGIIKLDSDADTSKGSSLIIEEDNGTIIMDIVPEETFSFVDIQRDAKLVWDLRLTDADGFVTVYFRVSPFIIKPVSTRQMPEVVEES